MKSNPTESRVEEYSALPKPNWLVILGAVVLVVVLGLLLGHSPGPPPPVPEVEVLPVDPPVNPVQVAQEAPASSAPGPVTVSSPVPVVADTRGAVATLAPESPLSIPEHWGIEITKVGMVAGGKALDMRYKVLDVPKATSLLYLTNYVYIYNQSNRKVLIVPFQRENQTSQKLVAGKTYFTLLPNKDGRVEAGSVVTVVLGGSRAENLVVN